jgi:hypothetical protein
MLARNYDAGAGFFIRTGGRLGTRMTGAYRLKIDIFCDTGSTWLRKYVSWCAGGREDHDGLGVVAFGMATDKFPPV